MSADGQRVGTRRDHPIAWLSAWRRGKRVALVLAALWCVVLGVGVSAAIVSRGSLGQTPTPVLVGVIAMLVMPGLSALAMRFDARVRRALRQESPARRPMPHADHARVARHTPGRHATTRELPARHENRPSERAPDEAATQAEPTHA